MPGKIFINYRREDSRADARSIYQRLERSFGAPQLFMDVDSIEKGRDFTKVLDAHLADSDVMLTIIGRHWLGACDENGQRRLDDPGDFVRLEVANALKRDIAVIPVLVDGARMPKAAQLPDDMKLLANRQASMVTHENFARDIEGLERDLKVLLGHKPRWRSMAAAVGAVVFAIGAASYHFNIPPWPVQISELLAPIDAPARTAGADQGQHEIVAAAQADARRRQQETAEAQRKAAEEADRVRRAAAESDRQRQEAAAAAARKKADEAERQRLAEAEVRRAAEVQAKKLRDETASKQRDAEAKSKAEEEHQRTVTANAEEQRKALQAAATPKEPTPSPSQQPASPDHETGAVKADLPREIATLEMPAAPLGTPRPDRPLSVSEEKLLRSGESFRECAGCPEMVVVPAGEFSMGSDENSESPRHQVKIEAPIAIGKYEVTFAEWDQCVEENGCKDKPDDAGWGRGTRPVIHVSWVQMTEQYLPWLSSKAGRAYRLLTEAEWEYAARAGSTTKYWWGDDIGRKHANCKGCGGEWDGRRTAPVGSFPPNAFGLHDMSGNVWERVMDCANNTYRGAPSDGSPWLSGRCSDRVIRGGSWFIGPHYVRSTNRDSDPAAYHNSNVGFRVARTLAH